MLLQIILYSMSGHLVTIEGIDGSGKTTVIEHLKQQYPSAYFTSEPQEDQWMGQVLRKALKNEELDDMTLFFLFMSEHSQHIQDYVIPNLEDGKLVISDRYMDSRYAYQSYALRDRIEGDSLEWIKSIQEKGWSRTPDKTIILDISVDVALERIAGNEKEVFEKKDRLLGTRETYLKLAENDPERYEIIDATKNPNEVCNEVYETIESLIN